jgi:hypothetical protein
MKSEFIRTLLRNDEFYRSYEELNEKIVRIVFSGENINEIAVLVSFGVTDSGTQIVNISCYELFNYEDKYAAGILACNQANDEGMIKYYIDEDKDVVAQSTLLFDAYGLPSHFSPELVLSQALMVALSVDDEYPIFARAKWS